MNSKIESTESKKESKKKLIIVHGWTGSPDRDWLPWLKSEMEKKGWEVVAPTLPNTNNPKLHEWLQSLTQVSGEVDEATYIIGHALGCITTLRFLENLSEGKSIGGAVLVAGFDNPLNHKELDNFFESPINWGKARSKSKEFVTIHSEDDPVVPADNGLRYKSYLGGKRILVNGYGHFAEKYGITALPLVLQELLEISK